MKNGKYKITCTILALIVLLVSVSYFLNVIGRKEKLNDLYECGGEEGRSRIELGDYIVLSTSGANETSDSMLSIYDKYGDYRYSIFLDDIYSSVHVEGIVNNEKKTVLDLCPSLYVSKNYGDEVETYILTDYVLYSIDYENLSKNDYEFTQAYASEKEYEIYDIEDFMFPGNENNYAWFLEGDSTYSYEVGSKIFQYKYFIQRTSKIVE